MYWITLPGSVYGLIRINDLVNVLCVCSTGGSVCLQCSCHCGTVCVMESLYHSSCSSSLTVRAGPAGET